MRDTGLILWADTETTGLDPAADYLLEVGFVLTDFQLNEKLRFHRVIKPTFASHAQVLERCNRGDAFAFTKHTKSGLLADVETADQWSNNDEIWLIDALAEAIGGASAKPYLGGRSVDFDRGFLKLAMPRLMRTVHHRNVDVSSFYAVWQAWTGLEPPSHDKGDHRVMKDIDDTINEAKFYRDALGKLRP